MFARRERERGNATKLFKLEVDPQLINATLKLGSVNIPTKTWKLDARDSAKFFAY